MSNYYQRNRNQNRQQQVVNPWQAPIAQAMAGGAVGGGVGGLHTNSNETALAFNILNQVLSTTSSSQPVNRGTQGLNKGFQDRNSRSTGFNNRIEDRRSRSSRWSRRSRSPLRANRASSNTSHHDDSNNRRSIADRLGRDSIQNRRNSQNRKSKSADRSHGSDKSSSKERDSKTNQDKDKKDQVKERMSDEQIVKCLKCHICEVDSFDSIESFRNHKKSEDHRILMNIINARSEAVVQVLKADAKLVANQGKEKAGIAYKESSYGHCVRCNIDFADHYKNHKRTIEHELVDNYLSRECCGSTFNKRKEFEEHCLTIPHLKRNVEPCKDNEPGKKVVLAHTEEEDLASDALRAVKETHRMTLDSPADFPEYDETKPTGLSHIHKKRRYSCTVCKKSFPSHNKMALAHCRSFNHYLMLSSHLETLLKEVEDEEDSADAEEPKESNNNENIVSEEIEKKEDEKQEKQGDASNNDEDLVGEEEDNEKDEEAGDGNEVENENDIIDGDDNIDGDEDMGETMPVLEDEGIILEESEKYAEENDNEDNVDEENDEENVDEENDDENTQEEYEDDMAEENDDNFVDSTEDQEEGSPDEEAMDAEEEEEKVENDDQTIDEEQEEDIKEDPEEELEEPEVELEEELEVKRKTRRGRGRGRSANFRRF